MRFELAAMHLETERKEAETMYSAIPFFSSQEILYGSEKPLYFTMDLLQNIEDIE